MSTDEKKSEVEAIEVKHPLMEFVPITFNLFEEWLAEWNGTKYLAEKLGLLHSLADEKDWWSEKAELISFLLSIADGWAIESFADRGCYTSHGGQLTKAEGRKSIAKKAFSVLCLKFFRSGKNEEPSWWWMLKHEILFQKVLWFLRRKPGKFKRLHNCSSIWDSNNDHQLGIYCDFLRKFSRLGWEFRCPESRRRWDEETRELVNQRLVKARPQFIDILRELGELDWLNGKEIELDVESIEKLTEMALGENFFLPPENASDGFNHLREPRSIEEAVLGGSITAEVVVLHQIKERERGRIRALYEASKKQLEEKQRIEELASIEKQENDLIIRKESITKP